MKRIYFLRTAPYEYQFPHKSLYESFDLVATRKENVKIKKGGGAYLKAFLPEEVFSSKKVFCSTTLRSTQTAQLVLPNPITKDELREVFYSMHDFIQENEFYGTDAKPHVTKARKAFVQALVTNNLLESYKDVIGRIEEFLDMLKHENAESITVFTHGFLLKIIEAYLLDKTIKTNPQKLPHYFTGESETFHFGEGFVGGRVGGEIIFKKYIRSNL